MDIGRELTEEEARKSDRRFWSVVLSCVAIPAMFVLGAESCRSRNQSLVNQCYEIASGEDGVMDKQERRRFLNNLGIASTLDKDESLYVDARPSGIKFYATTTKENLRILGKVGSGKLQDYIRDNS